METIHVQFDELFEPMAPVQLSTGPAPTFLTPGQISSGLIPNLVPAAPYVPPTNKELEILFQLMFDEYLEPPRMERPVSPAPVVPVTVNSAGSGYQQKDRKPSQNDKTEHGMEKTVQNQGQSPKMPKSESIQKNQQSNRSRN
ncbi:hypothetical protein Tco_1545988 [Tanacetum coccineum]